LLFPLLVGLLIFFAAEPHIFMHAVHWLRQIFSRDRAIAKTPLLQRNENGRCAIDAQPSISAAQILRGRPAQPQADGFNGMRRAVEPELRITIESAINSAFRFHGVEALSSERAASPARLNKTQIKQQPKKSIS
jgi:hypothetical protein